MERVQTVSKVINLIQQAILPALKGAKIVVDATAGNGNDTLFLAQHTPDDAKIVLEKVYNGLRPGGRVLFSTMNHEGHEEDFEVVDFSGVYKIGRKRYFRYWWESDLNALVGHMGFRIVRFFKYGGSEQYKKWLVYILEK